MNEKVDWLLSTTTYLFQRKDVHGDIKMQMMGELESLYDRAAELKQNQWRIGGRILSCYELMGMGDSKKGRTFYGRLVGDVLAVSDTKVQHGRFSEIIRCAKCYLDHDYSDSLIYDALFSAASAALPFEDALAVKQIARGYVAVNKGQKAIDILNDHERVARPHLVRTHMIHAIATSYFMGACWFSPHLVTLTAMTVAVTASIVSAVSCIKWCMTKKQQESDEQYSHCRT